MEAIGLLESASERLFVDDLGEIEERPGDGGDRDRIDDRPIARIESGVVDAKVPTIPTLRGDDVDLSSGAEETPQGCSAAMTQGRVRARSQH